VCSCGSGGGAADRLLLGLPAGVVVDRDGQHVVGKLRLTVVAHQRAAPAHVLHHRRHRAVLRLLDRAALFRRTNRPHHRHRLRRGRGAVNAGDPVLAVLEEAFPVIGWRPSSRRRRCSSVTSPVMPSRDPRPQNARGGAADGSPSSAR
jgi:hypothetical protein